MAVRMIQSDTPMFEKSMTLAPYLDLEPGVGVRRRPIADERG